MCETLENLASYKKSSNSKIANMSKRISKLFFVCLFVLVIIIINGVSTEVFCVMSSAQYLSFPL